ATAPASVRFGCAGVPGAPSSPTGETKIACWTSPSTPSQFESTKLRSGVSGAPGWIAGLLSSQSAGGSQPSQSVSPAVQASLPGACDGRQLLTSLFSVTLCVASAQAIRK